MGRDRCSAADRPDGNECARDEWFSCAGIGLLPSSPWPAAVRIPGPRDDVMSFTDVPAELSSCFARPPRWQDWLGPPSVTIARAPGPARPWNDGRLHAHVPTGELVGYLVVDDDGDELAAAESPFEPTRAPRARRPRFAFGSQAVQVLEHSLERAEPAFAWCYQRALQDRPHLSGHVAMRLAAPDGRGSIDATRTDVDDAGLQCCLANAQRLWTARVHGSAELRYTLDLRRAW